MHNKFRPYNKSLLVNVFMSREYEEIWSEEYIPEYNEINRKNKCMWDWTSLIFACFYSKINITRLLLSHPDIDVNANKSFLLKQRIIK